MFHYCCTVDDRVDFQVTAEIAGDISQNYVDSCSEERFECIGEIIVEQGAQAAFSGFECLAADQAVDILSVAVDEFAEDMHAQIASGTGYQYIAQRLCFSLLESLERIALKQGVDGGIVVIHHRSVAFLLIGLSRH